MDWPRRPDKTALYFNNLRTKIVTWRINGILPPNNEFKPPYQSKKIEFVRDELPAGWFGHLDINITLAKSYLAWCEDNMGVIVIRNLSLETHRALQARAARHNRSTEAEARMILDEAVRPKERVKLGSALAAFGRSVGGLDLDISRDPTSAKPIDLG
jgi:plasmid stability protein